MSKAELTPDQVIDVYEQRAELTATLEHAIKTKQMRPYLRTFSNRQLQAVCRGARLPPKSRKEANVDQLAELVENNKVKVLRVLKLVSQGSIFVLTALYMAGVLQFPAGTNKDGTDAGLGSGLADYGMMMIVCVLLGFSMYTSLPSIHKSFKRLRGKRRAKTIKELHKQIQELEFVPRSRSRSRSSSSSSRASSSASSRASSAPRTRRGR